MALKYTVAKNGERLLLFYGHSAKSGDSAVFSNFYPAPFVDPATKIAYATSEQYMMYNKALVFGDNDTAQAILATKEPAEAKKLGRLVANYDDDVWTERAREVVLQGVYLKFSQNERLRQILLSTGDAILVEAAGNDKRWGIGLSADDPRAKDPSQWKGTNWLGLVLMEARKMIQAELPK